MRIKVFYWGNDPVRTKKFKLQDRWNISAVWEIILIMKKLRYRYKIVQVSGTNTAFTKIKHAQGENPCFTGYGGPRVFPFDVSYRPQLRSERAKFKWLLRRVKGFSSLLGNGTCKRRIVSLALTVNRGIRSGDGNNASRIQCWLKKSRNLNV